MEQNGYNIQTENRENYEFEIVGYILREKTGHIREIARRLGVNHMAVARKIDALLKQNIIDFKQEGKNKVFFLKESLEAKSKVLIYENYNLIKSIEKYPILRSLIEKVQSDKRIELALIFGSYSKGIADKNSDIDLFVETDEQKIRKELLLLNSKLSIKIGKLDKNSDLGKEILKNHIIIKGAEQFYGKL